MKHRSPLSLSLLCRGVLLALAWGVVPGAVPNATAQSVTGAIEATPSEGAEVIAIAPVIGSLTPALPDTVDFAPAPPTLTLPECLRLSRTNNRAVRAATARTAAAVARRDQVYASQWPTVSGTMQRTHNSVPTSQTSNDLQDVGRLAITETVSPFGRHRAQRRAVRATIKASERDEEKSRIDVAFSVTQKFFDLLLAQQLVRVASDSLDQLQQHRNNTAELVKSGAAPRFDLLRAEVQLSSARPTFIRATHALTTGMAELLNLLGLDPAARPQLIGSFPETLPSDLPGDEEASVRFALEHRPDLAGARAGLLAAQAQMSVARQALQPNLTITGTREQSRGVRGDLNRYQGNTITQMALVFPMFDSGLSRAQTREAAANVEQGHIAVLNTIAAIRLEIRKALTARIEAEEVLKSQEKNVEQAEEALNIAQMAYKTGAKTAIDVLDAQVALTQARVQRYQALHDRAVAFVQFQRALGLTTAGQL